MVGAEEGEEATTVVAADYHQGGSDGGDDEHIVEWELDLPIADDLQPLIPSELTSTFSISPEPCPMLLELKCIRQQEKGTSCGERAWGIV